MDMPNDFIMKAGSVIDVSGGLVTYQEGYVYTSLLASARTAASSTSAKPIPMSSTWASRTSG